LLCPSQITLSAAQRFRVLEREYADACCFAQTTFHPRTRIARPLQIAAAAQVLGAALAHWWLLTPLFRSTHPPCNPRNMSF
jgi:hypothetical protein